MADDANIETSPADERGQAALVPDARDVGRNLFDEWCWRRNLTLNQVVALLRAAAEDLRAEVGRDLSVPSYETVRLVRLPFSDAARRVPGKDLMILITHMTGQEVQPADFYPRPADVACGEAGAVARGVRG